MKISIVNQKPAEIYQLNNNLPHIKVSTDSDQYAEDVIAAIDKQITQPLYTPIGSNPVEINDISDATNPIQIPSQAITDALVELWVNDNLDPDLDKQLNEIYRQSLLHYQPNKWLIDQQLSVEAMSKLKPQLPIPGATSNIVVYSPTVDLIPSAKSLLAQHTDENQLTWFGSLSGYLSGQSSNEMLLVTFKTKTAFDSFKATMQTTVSSFNSQGNISTNDNKLLSDFQNIELNGLSETILLPPIHTQNHAYSFTRILLAMLASTETNGTDNMTVQPINMSQLFMPKHIVMLNLEEYAHTNAREINDDWDSIQKAIAINNKMNFATNNSLTTASQVAAMTNRQTTQKTNRSNVVFRLKQRAFSGKPITSAKLLKAMSSIINNAITNKQTQNVYKKTSPSFMRPNRRKPDDPNLMGKVTSVKYRPDIHVYIDTSGSITEPQYRDTVVNLIALSKKIDANLYITSFSNTISPTTLLVTKDRSTKQIYADFIKIPKVTGGTDYLNVWTKIEKIDALNEKTGNSYQLNFIITDFEYNLPRSFKFTQGSPCVENTYYVPISTNTSGWKYILHYGNQFVEQMERANDPTIRARMIM